MVCVADYSGGAAAAAVVARESAHRHTAIVGTSSAGRIQRTRFLHWYMKGSYWDSYR